MTSGNPLHRSRLRADSRRGQRNADQAPGRLYQWSAGNRFDLVRFSRQDNLNFAYQTLRREGGHGAGNDGIRFEDVSPGEVYDCLRSVTAALTGRAYRPHPTLDVQIPKGDGRFRTLKLQRITDRSVAKALQLALGPFWSTRLPGIDRSVWDIYAEIQCVMRERRAYVLAIDDVRNCFPSVPIHRVLQFHQQHINQNQPDLLWLIETVIRGDEGADRTTGLDQGSPYSPVATELLLHTCLDSRLQAEDQGYPLLQRYVDNLTFICRSESEGEAILQRTTELLAETSLELKHKDGGPQDIRNPEYDTVLLGLIPRWLDGQLKFSIPERAYTELHAGLNETKNRLLQQSALRTKVTGWLTYLGPALTNATTPEVINRVHSITSDLGIRIPRRDLSNTARKSRNRWLEHLEEWRSTRGRRHGQMRRLSRGLWSCR